MTTVACRTSIDLLHGFGVHDEDGAIELPHAAQRLLAFIALQERPRERLFVAGTLWTDASEERAAASLRSTLWRIGKVDVTLILARGTTLELGDDIQVDLRPAAVLARDVVAHDGDHGLDDLDLESLSGDLLPDWYDDWVLLERERFRHLRLHALEALCGQLAGRGRFGRATEAGMMAIAGEPLRESAHRALIAAHLAEGNAGEALRQYRLCKRLFAEQLGMAPSARLDALVAHLPRQPCAC
jgi:DNA-binding SARP family transcriptional activator